MCKLIMIDDNPMEHLILQKLFSRYDIFRNAEHSFDAQYVIGFLRENRYNIDELPDLIFLDLDMPEYNGWLFLEDFKLVYPLFKKNINIYIISASDDPFDQWRLKSYPFVKDFYRKPVYKEQMEMLYLAYLNADRMAG